MRRVTRVAGVALCGVVIGCVGAAWNQSAPELSRDEAREFAARALRDAGLREVVVADEVEAGEYEREDGEVIDVWETRSSVRGGDVSLFVGQRGGRAVFVEDRTSDRSAQLLTDEQFRALDAFRYDPPLDRHVRRNVFASIGGVGIVVLIIFLVLHSPGGRPAP